MSSPLEILERAIQRERKARKAAEQTLEKKSYELFLANEELRKVNSNLEATVHERTLQLEFSEARFRSIIESASDIIFRINVQGYFTYVNPTAVKKIGYSKEELLQMNFTALVTEEHRSRVQQFYYQQAKNQQSESYLEFPVKTKAGTIMWLGQSVIYNFNSEGKIDQISAVSRDITEQQEVLDAIQKSESKYRNIISNMNLGLLEVDMEDQIQQANQSFCEMSGYTLEELTGHKASDLFLRGQHMDTMSRINDYRQEGISDAYEIIVKTKNGDARWWLISGGPLYDDKGKQIGTIGIHLDITEQKKLEYQLKDAKTKAEFSAKAKEIFLANMSHEIRTPMNGILGMARHLEKTELTQKQSFYLETITSAADHLLTILNDILDLSKIEAGKLEIEHVPFDLYELILKSKNILSPKAEEKGIQFHIDLDDGVNQELIGDPTRINQVIFNLMGNAIKFTDEGYVKISCELVKDFDLTQQIRFTISDTGIGMDASYLNKIFNKFSQEDKSVARKYGGTGLGMSISQQLIDLMDGTLDVASEKGKGTSISFEINLQKGSVEPSKKEPKEMDLEHFKSQLSNKKILLAEDNEMNQLVVGSSLDYIALPYTVANNGQEALEALEKEQFDLILMDVNMPVLDGIAATKKIRRNNNKIPIIALTANAMESAFQQFYDAGMNDVLTKPFEENDLFKVLVKWMANKEITIQPLNQQPQTHMQLYSLEKLERIARGNQTFINKMLTLFVEKVPDTMMKLKEGVANSDFDTIYKASHKIKPTFNDLDIQGAKDEIAEIETLAKTNSDISRIYNLTHQVDEVVQQVCNQIKEELKIKTE